MRRSTVPSRDTVTMPSAVKNVNAGAWERSNCGYNDAFTEFSPARGGDDNGEDSAEFEEEVGGSPPFHSFTCAGTCISTCSMTRAG